MTEMQQSILRGSDFTRCRPRNSDFKGVSMISKFAKFAAPGNVGGRGRRVRRFRSIAEGMCARTPVADNPGCPQHVDKGCIGFLDGLGVEAGK